MVNRLSVTAIGHATSLFLVTTFILCVAFDLLVPQFRMYETWSALLPGFNWITWPSFLLGMVESYAYGWYFALIWVPLYNLFARRAAPRSQSR